MLPIVRAAASDILRAIAQVDIVDVGAVRLPVTRWGAFFIGADPGDLVTAESEVDALSDNSSS